MLEQEWSPNPESVYGRHQIFVSRHTCSWQIAGLGGTSVMKQTFCCDGCSKQLQPGHARPRFSARPGVSRVLLVRRRSSVNALSAGLCAGTAGCHCRSLAGGGFAPRSDARSTTRRQPAGEHRVPTCPRPCGLRTGGPGAVACRHTGVSSCRGPAHARLLPKPEPRGAWPRRAQPGRGHFPLRLAGSFDYDLARDIAEHADYVLSRERIAAALLVGYGPEELVGGVAAVTSAWLTNERRARDAPEQAARRWRPVLVVALRRRPTCCPPEGRLTIPAHIRRLLR